ncbi:SLAM family member 9-like isoform X2 [Pygocentrus nattereri]|uniref:SLAM family member 9-like isoform X2 n=1 Tax=Pygocentrus nattereri TaxID=42514 RepID=UPI0008146A04|nr:SLAM family member 9-like isoform X2 [Pygocentrus nattereri]
MVMILQLILVLSTLISVTVPSEVLGLVGNSVQMDIQHPIPEFKMFLWVFNKNKNILNYNSKTKTTKRYSAYEGRVELNEKNYSLKLKNLQKTDSGLYEAKAFGDVDRVVAEYRLSVLDPVEAPVLTLQLSRDTCNITLTCRGHDLSIKSSCYKEMCEEKEVTSPGGITLSLSVNGSSIICNHSNTVSWKTDVLERRKLKQLCADEGSVSPSAGVSVCLLKIVLYSISLTLMLSAVITVHVRGRLIKSS